MKYGMKNAAPRALLPLLALAPLCLGKAEPPPSELDLSGRWARVEVTTALSDVPMIGGITSKTTSVVLLDVHKDAEGFSVEERVCNIENETLGGMVRARFPRAFLKAVSGSKTPARLVQTSSGLRYVEDRPLRVRGARLADSEAEDLPTRPDDPRIEDSDEDGRPGLTVKVEGMVEGEIYVVQRDKSALAGQVRDGRRIEGLVDWQAEQQVLGASRSMLETNPDNRPHPEKSKSWFRMRRVPRSATCDQVLRRVPRLFGI